MRKPAPRLFTGPAVAVLAAGTVLPLANPAPAVARPTPAARAGGGAAEFYDARQPQSRQGRDEVATRAARLVAGEAVTRLRAAIGRQAVVDIDGTTGTPRNVARLDGFLTARSSAPAAAVALGYVRAHRDVFRLSPADLRGLHLARDYVDIDGTAHLSWVQTVHGVPLFGNGLKANVARDGRLINVQGSPVSGLRAPAAGSRLTGSAAITAAKRDLGAAATAPAAGDTVKRVLFATAGGTRAAYQVVAMSIDRPALAVVDAATGRTLFRTSLTADAAAKTALVYDNYPGAPAGGTAHRVNLTAQGWLPASAGTLSGNNAHTYTDVNDDNKAEPTEQVLPTGTGTYLFRLQPVRHVDSEPCESVVCTWRPGQKYSWRLNRSQTATQNFYFINRYHDHLQAAPIGFTEAAGNFQRVNSTGQGRGGDAVQDQPLDGADTADGLPDGGHIDNANFGTPPDGQAPVMQMYLWHAPGASYPDQDPFVAVSGSDEADIVYHEYTHGLSHRLVVDADDVPALDSQQGGSMGEAWSDWYALDYLVDQHLIKDTAKPGQVQVGRYVLPDGNFRTEPTDCPVGASRAVCPGTPGAGAGGYTYGDFGKIYAGGPEVHADGEIWAQTLWDLRARVGSSLAESLITRGMELSPTYPSFLDMRNAIIQADLADHGGRHVALLWRVFAHRGMGFFAGTVTGNDTSPVEDFSLPPAAGAPTATVTGRVRDSITGDGVAGAVVAFGGHDSGFPGSYAATTGADGRYVIRDVFRGSYPDVYAGGAGYNSKVRTVVVRPPRTVSSFSLVRDWAAASGGAAVSATNGDDSAAYGCGAAALIDQALGNGWSTAAPASGGRYATIRLPRAVDIETLQIDPTGTCGDDLVASAARYTVETAGPGGAFRPTAAGEFTPADTGHLVTVPLSGSSGTAVRYVRYTILTNQAAERGVSCPGGAEGCPWLDSRELEVFGTAH